MGLGVYAVSRLVAWGIAVVAVLWSDCALRFGVIYKVFWVGFCVMGLLTSSLCCLRLLFGFDLILVVCCFIVVLCLFYFVLWM